VDYVVNRFGKVRNGKGFPPNFQIGLSKQVFFVEKVVFFSFKIGFYLKKQNKMSGLKCA